MNRLALVLCHRSEGLGVDRIDLGLARRLIGGDKDLR
jgi:hypothetical protein